MVILLKILLHTGNENARGGMTTCNVYVWRIFNRRSTLNPKCHVTFPIDVNWHLHFLLECSSQCHMPSNLCQFWFQFLLCQFTRGFFFFMSHTICRILNCACQLTYNFFFVCKFLCVQCILIILGQKILIDHMLGHRPLDYEQGCRSG